MRVCLAIFRFLFLNSLRLFNFIHACVSLITLAIETRPLFFAVSLIFVFRCEKFWPGDEASPLKATWRQILKLYKIRTRAANVTKEIFPHLISQLWERSFTSAHLKAAFKAAGLAPLNPKAIKPGQLSPALVQPSPSHTPRAENPDITFQGTASLAATQTPIRVELRVYFVRALKPSDEGKTTRRRRRVELSDFGEVLTSDEVLQRLQEAEEQKARKAEEQKARKAAAKKARAKKSSTKQKTSTSTCSDDTATCGKCGQIYTEDEAEDWIGCDECESWWHYWCAGLDKMLSEEEEWLCDFCQRHDC